MTTLYARLRKFQSGRLFGKFAFGGLLLLTALVVAFPKGSRATPSHATPSSGKLRLSTHLSQTKLVQNTDGTFYTEISIETPEAARVVSDRQAVDLVVVLDRSGSMLADNRLPFAKSAIIDLLGRLNESDRFALVTFDTSASVVSPLSPVTEAFRNQERSLVSSLSTGGSTNLSGGLELARGLLSSANDERKKKVILLSDGEANVGIVDPVGLSTLVRSMSQANTIVSTIGMGLGFNEVLMASLADNGMGNYGYLENLASLNEILQKELASTRAVYASASVLEIELPEDCTLIDTSGYPQEPGSRPGTIRVLTGQLMGGSKKTFTLTFRANTAREQTFAFGNIGLDYTVDGRASNVSAGDKLALSVIEKARESEAISSVDAEVFKKSWILNNFGKVQQEISREIRAGNAPAAKAAIANYESSVRANARRYRVDLEDDEMKQKLDGMNTTVDDLISSNGADKDEKANRAAKEFQAQGIQSQRQ